MSLKHPLKNVKGLGSSGEGSHHWWSQRMTAFVLIPLTVWFVISIIQYADSSFDEVIQWVEQPWVAVLLIIYLSSMFMHAYLGLQVVIEDYIHGEGLKMVSLLVTKGVLLLAGIGSIFAVLRIAL